VISQRHGGVQNGWSVRTLLLCVSLLRRTSSRS
jgi:hypothetical protein